MSDLTIYLTAAESLRNNPDQWAAYESKGHCVVLAGPGSGKTKTLTTKMARVLAEDVAEPRGVACITYNNECARELEDRLGALGIEPSSRVFIGTVHSFSLTQIILPYAKVAGLGLPDNFSVAARAQSRQALARALRETVGRTAAIKDWEGPMGKYRRLILDRDSDAWRDTNPKLAALVAAYEQELRSQALIDFDDMPLLAVRALRQNAWLRTALVAKYQMLVVDEYQDLGRPLHHMVMALCFRAEMRLFAVGDADQSIYDFMGARPELLNRLFEREDVESIRLRLNYRSGSRIIAASRLALGEDRGYAAVEGAPQGEIYFHALPRARYEAQATRLMTDLLPEALSRHASLEPGDVAILYPAAWIGDAVATAARDAGISVLRTDGNALYPRNSRLMQWLEQCAQWCCGGWQTGKPRFSRVAKSGLRLFIEAIQNEVQVLNFQRVLMTSLHRARNGSVPLRGWLQHMRQLFEPFAIRCVTLADELETLSTFMGRVAADGDCADMTLAQLAGNGTGRQTINLSTLHSAKGREFGIVFMFAMDEGRLPWNDATARQLAEFRRQFYVGLTRAKYEVHLIWTTGQISRFVEEVQQRLGDGD